MPTLSARFSSPSTPRSIRPDLLVDWLRPYEGYLEDRGLKLPGMQNGEGRRENENGHLTPALSTRGGEGEAAERESAECRMESGKKLTPAPLRPVPQPSRRAPAKRAHCGLELP